MPKVHGGDKVVDPVHKSETQARREVIPKLLLLELKFVSHPQRKFPQFITRKGQGRSCVRKRLLDPDCNHSLSLLPYLQYPLYKKLPL